MKKKIGGKKFLVPRYQFIHNWTLDLNENWKGAIFTTLCSNDNQYICTAIKFNKMNVECVGAASEPVLEESSAGRIRGTRARRSKDKASRRVKQILGRHSIEGRDESARETHLTRSLPGVKGALRWRNAPPDENGITLAGESNLGSTAARREKNTLPGYKIFRPGGCVIFSRVVSARARVGPRPPSFPRDEGWPEPFVAAAKYLGDAITFHPARDPSFDNGRKRRGRAYKARGARREAINSISGRRAAGDASSGAVGRLNAILRRRFSVSNRDSTRQDVLNRRVVPFSFFFLSKIFANHRW